MLDVIASELLILKICPSQACHVEFPLSLTELLGAFT